MNLSFSTRGWGDLSWDQMLQEAVDMRFGGVEVYNLFKFIHEERSGGVKCKGVKYKESWFSLGYSNLDEYRKAQEKLAVCDKYYNPITNNEYLNNYHPIPSNKNIEKALAMIFPYDIVYLE